HDGAGLPGRAGDVSAGYLDVGPLVLGGPRSSFLARTGRSIERVLAMARGRDHRLGGHALPRQGDVADVVRDEGKLRWELQLRRVGGLRGTSWQGCDHDSGGPIAAAER